ncbi:unnamed protein product [Scytosiphon promiscuus]
MTESNDDSLEEHGYFCCPMTSGSPAAARSRVDLVVASIENCTAVIPPPSDAMEVEASCPSNSSREGDDVQLRASRTSTGLDLSNATSLSGNETRSDHGEDAIPVAAPPPAGSGEGSPPCNRDDSSSSGLPSRLTSHSPSLVARTTTERNAVEESREDSPLFTARTSSALPGSVSGNPSRDVLSRSISSRSRRSTSVSSIRPLVPAARGLGLPSLARQSLPARALSEGARGALSFSPSSPPHGLGAGDAYRRRASSRSSSSPAQNEQHPLSVHSSRLPARQARPEGGRASVRRLAGSGRDSWRAPAAAYNVVERRTGRDTTALRAVSARLDAAATAIDAVEIGVRSASDSLDSLLQLLESRPRRATTPRAAVGSSSSLENRLTVPAVVRLDSRDPARVQEAAWEAAPEVTPTGVRGAAAMSPGGQRASAASRSTTLEAPEGLADDPSSVGVTPEHTVGREGWADAGRFASAQAREAGGGSRAANMLRRELAASSVPRVRQPEDGERAESDEHVAGARETSVGTRDGIFEELKGEPSTVASENPTGALSKPRFSSSPARHDVDEGSVRSGSSEGRESSGRGGVSRSTHSDRHAGEGVRLTSSTRIDSRALGGSGTPDVATAVGSEVFRQPSDAVTSDNPPHASHTIEGRQVSPRATVAIDRTGIVTVNNASGAGGSYRSDVSLPVRELEAAMDGIDMERGRLIMEIARLRGQQNQSLVHLQRLQNEQFVVRQRQVSTLSDIVNSFGRTVAAAGALPHGENSSLGRISSDVVSTLRRMLRLLSATVPAAIAVSPSSATVDDLRLPAIASTPQGMRAPPHSTPSTPIAGVRDSSAANDAAGTSVGARMALRPTGVDLTQEVIDAALQALPRLAAAASAISGARRMQGYLAGLAGDADERSGGAGRCCSTETIDALPDAPASTAEGVVGENGNGRGCVICLSEGSASGQSLCSLPCDHVFHRACVGKWLRMQDSCPTCRRQVPDVEIGSATCPRQVV